MRALTLHQPWASLIAIGEKTIETRSWSTQYRGPLAIHAAKRRADHGKIGTWYIEPAWITAAGPVDGMAKVSHAAFRIPLILGAVVAICELIDVIPMVTDTSLVSDNPVVFDVSSGRFVCNNSGGEMPPGWSKQQTGARNRQLHAQKAYGHFAPGRFAWILDNIVRIDEPVPVRGSRRLWEWEPTREWA